MRYEQETVGLIHAAHQKAKALGHSYVGSEHLLMGLLSAQGVASSVLSSKGITKEKVEDILRMSIGVGTPGSVDRATGVILYANNLSFNSSR